jgi:RING-box protein 1
MAEVAAPEPEKACAEKYQMQSVNLVCTWRFGAGFIDTCAICKASLYEASLDCQAHNIEDTSNDGWHIANGTCGHAYHYDCIKKFVERGITNCPTCNAAWEEKSIVPIAQMTGAD